MPADHWGVSLLKSTKCYDYNFISLKERNGLQHLVALMLVIGEEWLSNREMTVVTEVLQVTCLKVVNRGVFSQAM